MYLKGRRYEDTDWALPVRIVNSEPCIYSVASVLKRETEMVLKFYRAV
jgi:hypothetical protein